MAYRCKYGGECTGCMACQPATTDEEEDTYTVDLCERFISLMEDNFTPKEIAAIDEALEGYYIAEFIKKIWRKCK